MTRPPKCDLAVSSSQIHMKRLKNLEHGLCRRVNDRADTPQHTPNDGLSCSPALGPFLDSGSLRERLYPVVRVWCRRPHVGGHAKAAITRLSLLLFDFHDALIVHIDDDATLVADDARNALANFPADSVEP
jgi:hypothetical protein